MILRRVFEGRSRGYYVDVGAHHPRRFSNTYYFYKRGWSGINVDATPGSMALFRRWRPRDINLEMAIGLSTQPLTFYLFNEPALNTFDPALAQEREKPPYRVVERRLITPHTLTEILSQYLPAGQHIDFLTVDVEGLDLMVLQSNDWQRFRPSYVLVECFGATPETMLQNPIYQYLRGVGYRFFAMTVNTAFFRISDYV